MALTYDHVHSERGLDGAQATTPFLAMPSKLIFFSFVLIFYSRLERLFL